jgi:predicted acylesterase/phospholipase RssA
MAARTAVASGSLGVDRAPKYSTRFWSTFHITVYSGSLVLPIVMGPSRRRNARSMLRVGRHLYGDGGVVSIFPVRPLIDFEEPCDLVFGVNCYYPENFAGEEITGWRNRSWAILRAAGQLRACMHLELAREQAKRLGPRLVMLHPVPYTEVRGAKFYESFLDRSRWPRFMRQGYRCARAMLDRTHASESHARTRPATQ